MNIKEYLGKRILYCLVVICLLSNISNCRDVPNDVTKDDSTERASQEWHVFFRINVCVFEATNNNIEVYDAWEGESNEIHCADGTSYADGGYNMMRAGTICSDGINTKTGQGIGKITPQPVSSVSLDCWGREVSETGISFDCTGGLQEKEIKKQFNNIKWDQQVTLLYTGNNYALYATIQPHRCNGCPACLGKFNALKK